MKIIISPAKKMIRPEFPYPETTPVLLERSRELKRLLLALDEKEYGKLIGANEALTAGSRKMLYTFEEEGALRYPALFSYDGIQYKYMAPDVFTKEEFDYARSHIRIISGFYGILSPFDGICPYRLEMQAKLRIGNLKSLYDYWKEDIASALLEGGEDTILNLASEEYSRAVLPYLGREVRIVNFKFYEDDGRNLKEKGVYAKMMRGSCVRYLAENSIEDVGKLKDMKVLGFSYSESLSTEDFLVFARRKEEAR